MSASDLSWFRAARYGLFIHWGLYSLLKQGEWAMHQTGLPVEEYERLADRFRPPAGCAREWARLARRAGMKYAVLTTKHHDGFCLFDSALTDYNAVRRCGGRDFVREYADAFRAEGLRVGLYYSLGDWHFPAYRAVAGGDTSQTRVLREFLHGQVRELMTQYGRIDVLWYDGAWYDGRYLSAELLDAAGMNAMARRLQPGILINERAGTREDYATCENECKPAPFGADWEMCTCINDLWGYAEHDYNYKTVNQLIFMLANCAVQGGNLLLNIGPRADGTVPEEQTSRLEAVGRWLELHGEAIYGVERLPYPYFGAGRLTRRGRRLYLHTFYWPGEMLRVPRLGREVLQAEPGTAAVRATVLTTGQPARSRWDGDVLVIEGLPASPPDRADTVIALDVAP
ncbi:MAG: Alpha-L-fucosidase [Lentisphaerae bacterium ADurb.BinA184]|nr:MAG: Alpha-L-fucosidase [Lentisphaerae bacterium ADurb.BinA184]